MCRYAQRRTRSHSLLAALVGVLAACGSVTVDPSGHDGVNHETSSTSSSTGGAGGGLTDGGGTCTPPPPPSQTKPDQPGCYVNMGAGWLAVPCSCDLWLENSKPAPVTASIQLVVTPPDPAPALAGALDAEIAFEDPDATWFALWTKQAGNGTAFLVTHQGGTTTVRMGEATVALLPVPLGACATRKATAHVYGAAVLSMHAGIDGIPLATMATCSNPPPT